MNPHRIDKDAPVWQMTVGELIYCIKESLPPQIFSSDNHTVEEQNVNNDDYIKGLKNLANFLGISYSQVWRLKRDGVFDEAIIQRQRTILIHKKKALELLAKEPSK
ncbi:DUF3853 family protein [Riemerella anatipestifer]|nr:DUF3853 family protein [Riemerella anatipestifer]MDY3400674.1 DUF3853 family protein [Riemerella anatipestifer]